MNRTALLLTLLLTTLAFGLVVAADSTKVATTPAAAPKKLHQQNQCPVMGKKIDKKNFIDIQGQRVYFCCAGCSDKLKADPETYFKKAAADGVLFENVQKVCPISGEKFDKKIYTDYVGRRVYFCCRKCRSTFANDPMKYLQRFDMPADSVKWDKDMM